MSLDPICRTQWFSLYGKLIDVYHGAASDLLHSSPDGETNRTEETPGPVVGVLVSASCHHLVSRVLCHIEISQLVRNHTKWCQFFIVRFRKRPDVNRTANKPLSGGLDGSCRHKQALWKHHYVLLKAAVTQTTCMN